MGLITAQEIRTNTSMGGNVDADKFMHLLNDVQIMIVEPLLGTALYNKIVTDFNEGGTNNLAGDYLTLFNDYIKPILWHGVFAEFLRDGIILASNGGIFTHQPDNAVPSSIEDIIYVQKSAQSKVDTYIDRCVRYLCDKDLPEYTQSQTNDYDLYPRNVQSAGGWWFGTGRRKSILTGSGTASGNYLELE